MTDESALRHLRALLSVNAEAVQWMDLALCAEVDPDLHYPEKGEATRAAKQICMACDVRLQCLQYALEHNEHWGIWGATSPRERGAMRRQQARQVAA